MSSLFHKLRIHQVFGANTDVGKTIITAALVRSSAAAQKNVFYLKPVSTGPMADADDAHVLRYSGAAKERVKTACLFRYNEPVSPHLAARLDHNDHNEIPSDQTFVSTVQDYIRRCASETGRLSDMYVETAGGVHSPTLSGTTQLDAYRPLFLPTILVGDSKLGGISSTIAAYESASLRGYIVDAILMFRDDYYRNSEYLKSYFEERGVDLFSFEPPPERVPNPSADFASTQHYYDSLLSDMEGMTALQAHLDKRHQTRLEELETMPRRTLDSVWWPFVQHGLVQGEKDVAVIDSAQSDFFSVFKDEMTTASEPSLLRPSFDGSASWWTQALGHAHPSLTLAAARASGRYGHVIFPKATHLPALQLAERLVRKGPGKGWASRAYFSDDGSTGMEVALKMALRAYASRHRLDHADKKSLGILGLKGSYHGDTIGAMDACEEGVYTCEWHHAKGYWMDPPTVSVQNGLVTISLPPSIAADAGPSSVSLRDTVEGGIAQAYDIVSRLDSPLAHVYHRYIQRTLSNLEQSDGPKLAALVLEPLVMGAGGMIFVDPLFQRVLINVVRGPVTGSPSQWSGMPVIFDEVFVGLYRLGLESTGPLLGAYPDISVNAKILTGGLVPLAVTLASDSIFQAFWSDKKADALLHGHSYAAHPVGCEVANETLKIIDKVASGEAWQGYRTKWRAEVVAGGEDALSPVWSFWDPEFVKAISGHDLVREVMTLGTVLAIKVKGDDGLGYSSHSAETLFQSISKVPEEHKHMPEAQFDVNSRTLGDVAYFMTSLNTSSSVVRMMEDRIWQTLSK